MGNASSADAGEDFLTITKTAASSAVGYLELYEKSSSAAAPSSPSHQHLSSATTTTTTGDELQTPLAYHLKIPPLFKDTRLVSGRALDTITRVDNFISKHVLPRYYISSACIFLLTQSQLTQYMW